MLTETRAISHLGKGATSGSWSDLTVAAASRAFIFAIDAIALASLITFSALLVTLAFARVCEYSSVARSWRLKLSTWRTSSTQSLSSHEVTSLVAGGALAASLLVGAVAVAVEDDIVDTAALAVLTLVVMTIGAALTTIGALLAYVASPVGAGSVWRKVVFDDVVNFALYVLRVFLCWTRYIFYDLQVEGVDIALQQTDALFIATHDAHCGPLETLSWVALDNVALVAQLGLSLAKLFLAAFLLWLVVDLFVLRPLAKVHSRWRGL